MTDNQQLTGLYAITDQSLASDQGLIHQVSQALKGGARVIQYRDKSSDQASRREEASLLLKLCRQQNIPLIINDDVALAADIGADGVHLGKNDPNLNRARQQLGPDAIIGISCYNSFELALDAQQAGADYVAFGRFFPSQIKPEAVQAELQLLQRARQELQIPTVAIGGITPENGGDLIQAGADMLAVIHGIFGQPDIEVACRQFHQLFEKTEVSAP